MGRLARRLLRPSPGKVLAGGGGGGGGGGVASIMYAKLYGGASDDWFYAVCTDASYIYAVGYTNSEGPGANAALIVKFVKSDMSIAARKIYGGAGDVSFWAVRADDDYVYAIGRNNGEGSGGDDWLIVKFNKSDLSVAAAKLYGGASDDDAWGVCVDDNYVYVVGWTDSEGQGTGDALIIKLNKTDLSIAARKVYGGAGEDEFLAVCDDDNYVYAVGITDSEGQGGYDCLIVKFNKADLSIDARKVYGGASDEYFYGVFVDGIYVYAVGATSSEGLGPESCLIVKFAIADLSIAARKIYYGAGDDVLTSVFVYDNYVYAVGFTESEGEGNSDGLLLKFNKADLTFGVRRVWGGVGLDELFGVFVYGSFIDFVGWTTTAGQGGADCLLVKSTKDIIPVAASVPPGFVCAVSNLTLADSGLTLNDSALTLNDSALTLQDSAAPVADSGLTLSGTYVIA
jgi:hypothetical protein